MHYSSNRLVTSVWRIASMVAFSFTLLATSASYGMAADSPLEVGFAKVDVTPQLDSGETIYLAGLEKNRIAEDVHDPLFARAVVLKDGEKTIALVSVDSIGLQRQTIEAARKRLDNVDYALVASTHSHATPDVIGIWGPSETEYGVTESYVKQVEGGIVEAVEKAAAATVPAKAFYGTASDQELLGDFRLPRVYDPTLRVVRFERDDDGKPCGILVQWNAHGIEPRDNPLISRDYMGITADELAKRHDCPVVLFNGAIGGLMGTPNAVAFQSKIGKQARSIFHFIELYGQAVADLADEALTSATPIELTPLVVSTKPIAIPLDNQGYRIARKIGVLRRPAFEWTGSRDRLGAPVAPEVIEGDIAMETEVAYLRLGELDVAAIPGELYPELVYGEFQEPVDLGADFPDAPLETPLMKTLPGDKALIIGLANDEVGYIVPKRQWDVEAPYCYERKSPQYGEQNSVGPETARILTEALADRVREVQGN